MSSPLIAGFEDCTLPPGEFHHEQHVQVVWCYLREMPLATAAARFIGHLKRYASTAGKPGLYHETITWALLILTDERMRQAPDADWDEFRRANRDLLTWKPSILDRYYRPETLRSDRARAVFVFPDAAMYEALR